MGPAGRLEPIAGRVGGSGVGGVVSRSGLFERLGAAARVTVVSAPPGSGKTILLRSWIDAAGLAARAAWVSVGHDERDPQRFWVSLLGALRQTSAGSALVDIRPHLEAEGRRVAELRADGLIRDVFLKADRSGPILLLNDTSAAEAPAQLATLPFIEHDLVTFDYIELDDNSPA
jgi:ATP/maltotriose-dependent transcriptional regulator MalT